MAERINKEMKIHSMMTYRLRKGNKGAGRKIIQIKDELGLSNETETMRYCIQKVWKEMFSNQK